MKLKLDTAAIAGAIAATEANKADAAAVDLNRIKADFKKRLMECVAAKNEVIATIQKNLDFIKKNAAIEREVWGDRSERWYAGDDKEQYYSEEYTKEAYDVEINLKDGIVTEVCTNRVNLANAKRIGVGSANYTYPALCVKNEMEVDQVIDRMKPESVKSVGNDISKTEEWYETIHLPLVGLLFAHIRDRAARLAAQLHNAEDGVKPTTVRRVIIEVVTETRN